MNETSSDGFISPAKADLAGPLRIGSVPYLNAEPLVWGLDAAPDRAAREVRLERLVPRRLAEAWRAGELDAAIIPVGGLLEIGGGRVVPGLAIACDGPVRSVLMISKKPPAEIRSLLMDCSSMTSVLLARLILRDGHGVEPAAELSPEPLRADNDFAADPHDAFVIIGDEALRLRHNALAHRIDLGEAWKRLTGLPFVFAVWVVPDADDPVRRERAAATARLLRETFRRSRENMPRLCREAAARYRLPPELVREYLLESVRHGLGPEERRAIDEFARRLRASGLMPAPRPLRWHNEADTPTILQGLD